MSHSDWEKIVKDNEKITCGCLFIAFVSFFVTGVLISYIVTQILQMLGQTI
jgi:hypothetical protein